MTKSQDVSNNHQQQPPSFWQQVKDNVSIVGLGLVLAIFIRIFIAEPRFIPSESMYPTLDVGDRLVVEKISYNFTQPHNHDIIVFTPPIQLQAIGYDQSQAFIKRIIAHGGETVAVQDGIVYVNNQPLTEDYILETPAYNLPPITVPEEHIFVMGDNRNNSNDSHLWGFLPQENVIGKAIFTFWPPSHFGQIR